LKRLTLPSIVKKCANEIILIFCVKQLPDNVKAVKDKKKVRHLSSIEGRATQLFFHSTCVNSAPTICQDLEVHLKK
jgi:hypothetical protein